MATSRVEEDLRIPIRDGVHLGADLYLPDGPGPHPVLIQRTPYERTSVQPPGRPVDGAALVRAGYAVLVTSCRGRYASEGTFRPFVDEGADGVDTIEWTTRQPWSSGKVGMLGGSYSGVTQWLAAVEAPPSLGAIAPLFTPAEYLDGWTYRGGACELGFLWYWVLVHLALPERLRRPGDETDLPTVDRLVSAIDGLEDLYAAGPSDRTDLLERLAPYYRRWLERPDDDAEWQSIAPAERFGRVTAPSLNIAGWFDIFLGGSLACYRGVRDRASGDGRNARLIIGPWSHGTVGGHLAGRFFGHRSSSDGADMTAEYRRRFDHWLLGVDNGIDREPPVRYFVMGPNEWRDALDWPPPDTIAVRLVLHSDGRAVGTEFGGALSRTGPLDELPDELVYDPLRPVPTRGGATLLNGSDVGDRCGPVDMSDLLGRPDVASYGSAPLAAPVEVIGPLSAEISLSSSASDTDLVGAVVDIDPPGRAVLVSDGILRLRYRSSRSHPEPLRPGVVETVTLDLGATAWVFEPGHRIGLILTSSNFPRFDPNGTTWPSGSGSAGTVTARTAIHHARIPRPRSSCPSTVAAPELRAPPSSAGSDIRWMTPLAKAPGIALS